MELKTGQILLLVFAGAMALLFSRRGVREALIEALNNFRGGPPAPMHPSPADDGFLLRKRRRKAEN